MIFPKTLVTNFLGHRPNRLIYRLAPGALIVSLMILSAPLMASNMGFRLKQPLVNGFILAQAPQGENWISLPYANPWPSAKDLCTARFGDSLSVTIAKLDPQTGATTSFNCGQSGGFLLMDVPRGIKIRITGSSFNSVILVGSHDGTKPLPTIYGGFVLALAPKGDNWISVPFHTTWMKAEDVCVTLNLGPGQGGQVVRKDAATGSSISHPCGTSVNNFDLVLGEAIMIRKTSQGDIVGVIPPHR